MILVGFISFLVLVQPVSLSAFDGQRKGFIIGLEVGPGLVHVRSNADSRTDELSRGALSLNATLGYAPSNTFQIYFYHRMNVFKFGELGQAYEDWFEEIQNETFKGIGYILLTPFVLPFLPVKASHSAGGIGFSGFVNESAPSFFFSGGFGWSIIADPYLEDLLSTANDTMGGIGLVAGVGYEFRPNVSTELQFMYGSSDRGAWSDYDSRSAFSVSLVMKVLAY
jgi:opacity protein-like surface antigen